MNQQEIVVTIRPTGVVTALHFDEFDLGFLGDKKIGRASSIKFDESDQSFYILVTGETNPPEVARGFGGYDIARNFEVEWLQACMKAENVRPHSAIGLALAATIRHDSSCYSVHGRKAGGV